MIAFEAADLTTFATIGEAALLTLAKIPSASLTCFPLIKSKTRRALRGVTRTSLATALAEVTAGLAGFSSTFFASAFLAGAFFAGSALAASTFFSGSAFAAAGFFAGAFFSAAAFVVVAFFD